MGSNSLTFKLTFLFSVIYASLLSAGNCGDGSIQAEGIAQSPGGSVIYIKPYLNTGAGKYYLGYSERTATGACVRGGHAKLLLHREEGSSLTAADPELISLYGDGDVGGTFSSFDLSYLGLLVCAHSPKEKCAEPLKLVANSMLTNPDGSVTYMVPRVSIGGAEFPLSKSDESAAGACLIAGKGKPKRVAAGISDGNPFYRNVGLSTGGLVVSYYKSWHLVYMGILTCGSK